jgi:hypothetical protein
MNALLNKYFDLNSSNFLSALFYISYLILHISIGISTKTLWADGFSRIKRSKVVKKPFPRFSGCRKKTSYTEGSLF